MIRWKTGCVLIWGMYAFSTLFKQRLCFFVLPSRRGDGQSAPPKATLRVSTYFERRPIHIFQKSARDANYQIGVFPGIWVLSVDRLSPKVNEKGEWLLRSSEGFSEVLKCFLSLLRSSRGMSQKLTTPHPTHPILRGGAWGGWGSKLLRDTPRTSQKWFNTFQFFWEPENPFTIFLHLRASASLTCSSDRQSWSCPTKPTTSFTRHSFISATANGTKFVKTEALHDLASSFPQTYFICRGSRDVGKGALMCNVLRWRLPANFFGCNLHYLVIWPSKPACEVNALNHILHFSWGRHRFLWLGASWSPMAAWSPRCFPDAS